MPEVSCDEVGGTRCDRCQQDWTVFRGQCDLAKVRYIESVDEFDLCRERSEPLALWQSRQIASRFLNGIPRGAKSHTVQLPELREARIGRIRGREKDVGVQKQAIQQGLLTRYVLPPVYFL